MVNLGMDFGSTYTTVSVYREDTETLEALILGQGGALSALGGGQGKRGDSVWNSGQKQDGEKRIYHL